MALINQRIVLAMRPEGKVRSTDFLQQEVSMPDLGTGEILLEIVFLSIDPYMRWWLRREKSYNEPIEIGQLMVGGTLARVRQSRHTDWQEGDWVQSFSGWQRFAISNGSDLRRIDPGIAPPSTALGVLGMTGFTAYAGLRNIGQPKPRETVVVAAASGAVGSVVGQIAKLRGARAVGITTGSEKLSYAKDELGFDVVVDHRAPDFAVQLADACPRGIDVYFESVGGHIWTTVLPLLNTYARVPVCGLISQYEASSEDFGKVDQLPNTMAQIMGKSLTVRGFIQTEYASEQFSDFLMEVGAWIGENKLRYREHIFDDLERAPDALVELLAGRNLGKTLVRVSDI